MKRRNHCAHLIVLLFSILSFGVSKNVYALPYDTAPVKRIHCGGGAFTDSAGNVYAADTVYSASTVQGYVVAGATASTTEGIIGTSDPSLYQSIRWGNIEYDFDVPVGVYDIMLKFAETNFTAPGQRKFRVYLQDVGTSSGTRVMDDFDIYAEAGGKNRAFDRTITNVAVNEGVLKIRFTSNYPGGADFPCVSGIEVKKVNYSVGDVGMSDDAFLDMVERKAFDWYASTKNVSAPYYLCPAFGASDDSWDIVLPCNISGVGFQIVVYAVGVSRGWMTYDEAYTRVKGMLDGVKLMKKGFPTPSYDNPYETYWHYYTRTNPVDPLKEGDSAQSVYDNGNLMIGIVFAQEYFKGTEIEVTARQLYESLDWNKFGNWAFPAEYSEQMIGLLLGASSPRASCRNATMIDGFKNSPMTDLNTPLYFYQWFNNFFDGRTTSNPSGGNHFQYAREATLQNRQNCINWWQADPAEYNTYDYDSWGYTASARTTGYSYSTINSDINPFAVAASMPFAPTEVLNAMKHMYFRFYKNGYPEYKGAVWSDKFGFCQTYNIGTSASAPYCKEVGNGSFDFAPIVFGIENYRTGFVWQHIMNSEYIKAGLYRIGMTGYTTPPPVNIAQDKTCMASSVHGAQAAGRVSDDDLLTRWESDTAATQWLSIDLAELYQIEKIELFWDATGYAKAYTIQVSSDNASWTDVATVALSPGGANRHEFSPAVSGRYVRLYCTENANPGNGYSLLQIKAFGSPGNAPSLPEGMIRFAVPCSSVVR